MADSQEKMQENGSQGKEAMQQSREIKQQMKSSESLQQPQSSQIGSQPNMQQAGQLPVVKHCPICGGSMKGDDRTGYICLDCFLIFDKDNVK